MTIEEFTAPIYAVIETEEDRKIFKEEFQKIFDQWEMAIALVDEDEQPKVWKKLENLREVLIKQVKRALEEIK